MDGDDVIKSARQTVERLVDHVAELQEAISNADDVEIQVAADALARMVEGLRVMLEPQEPLPND